MALDWIKLTYWSITHPIIRCGSVIYKSMVGQYQFYSILSDVVYITTWRTTLIY